MLMQYFLRGELENAETNTLLFRVYLSSFHCCSYWGNAKLESKIEFKSKKVTQKLKLKKKYQSQFEISTEAFLCSKICCTEMQILEFFLI